MTHTKGPWAIEWMPFMGEFDSEGDRNPDVAFIGPTEDDQAVAIVFPPEGEDPYDSPTLRANANLVAAAPDLLEACELALKTLWFERGFATLDKEVRAIELLQMAIEKARSEL